MLQKISSDEEVPRCPVSGPGDSFFQEVLATSKKNLTLAGQIFLFVLARDSKTDTVETEDMIHKNAIAT